MPRAGGDRLGVNLTLDVKQHNMTLGGSSTMNPPAREVPSDIIHDPAEALTNVAVFPVNVMTT